MTATRHVCVYKISYTNDNKFKQMHERKLTTQTSKNKIQTTTLAVLKKIDLI